VARGAIAEWLRWDAPTGAAATEFIGASRMDTSAMWQRQC